MREMPWLLRERAGVAAACLPHGSPEAGERLFACAGMVVIMVSAELSRRFGSTAHRCASVVVPLSVAHTRARTHTHTHAPWPSPDVSSCCRRSFSQVPLSYHRQAVIAYPSRRSRTGGLALPCGCEVVGCWSKGRRCRGKSRCNGCRTCASTGSCSLSTPTTSARTGAQ
jgi:hypothetical protein